MIDVGVANDPFRYIFIRDNMGECSDVIICVLHVAPDMPAEIAVKTCHS